MEKYRLDECLEYEVKDEWGFILIIFVRILKGGMILNVFFRK